MLIQRALPEGYVLIPTALNRVTRSRVVVRDVGYQNKVLMFYQGALQTRGEG